ncbi:DUF4902 domain-containing protein [Chitinimonas sp. BJB300]|uniref:DUF4902 domain-containing protein n=1 Tax=Chitinimonas sp. BJB300 TaxID=1559339 RepID=UPI0013043B93|nr:DUF4902 domain-containing protein [Chitinimonas sp. BJB300]
MLALAPDGLIRLTFADLCSTPIKQLMVWQDTDLLNELKDWGIKPSIAGFCEWVSETTAPQISIGWAWFLPSTTERPILAPGGVSSNVMLRTQTGYDLGSQKTAELLLAWVTGLEWQGLIARH